MKLKALLFFFLFILSAALPEDSFFELLARKLMEYNKSGYGRTLQLIFNQEKFVAGDTAYFSAFIFNSGKAISKEIIQITLSNPGGLVLRMKFILKSGTASNYLALPPDLSPGVYSVCGYAGNPAYLIYQGKLVVTGLRQISAAPQPTLEFYPEGGKLIAGVLNHVVIKVHPTAEKQIIKIKNSQSLLDLEIDSHGFGSFDIIPKMGEVVQADLITSSGIKTFSLPATERDGCSLIVKRQEAGCAVMIGIPENSEWSGNPLYLVLANRNRILFKRQINSEVKKEVINIPGSDFPQGLSQITLFDSNQKVLAERLVFSPHPQQIGIAGIKESYSNREVVDLTLKSTVRSLAFRVVKKDLFAQGYDLMDIGFDQMVQGQFSRDVLNNSRTADEAEPYLIASSFRLVNWSQVLNKRFDAGEPVVSTLEVSGRALMVDTGEPVPDSSLMAVLLQRDLSAYEIRTGKSGRFKVSFLFDFEGADDAFYIASKDGKELKPVKIELDKDELAGISAPLSQEENQDDAYAQYAAANGAVSKAFRLPGQGRQKYKDWNIDFEDEFMGADRSYNLDEYLMMPTMTDVVKEIIPALMIRHINGKECVRVVIHTEEKIPPVATDEPLYCIDGIITKDSQYFLTLNPADVYKIKLIYAVHKLERFGLMGKNGIVIVQTKRTKPEPIPGSSFSILGTTAEALPAVPDYAGAHITRTPDFRSCLYFNFINRPGESTHVGFYTSDDVGEYRVQVWGFTEESAIYTDGHIKISFQ